MHLDEEDKYIVRATVVWTMKGVRVPQLDGYDKYMNK